MARAAEQMVAAPEMLITSFSGEDIQNPLFVGVDNTTVPANQIDPSTNDTIQAFVGAQVWGAAYDQTNNRVFFNHGTTLYEWPVG